MDWLWQILALLLGAGKQPEMLPSETTVRGYAVEIVEVADSAKLELIPNYQERLPAKTLMEQNGCVAGINGGFYDKANEPLGLLTIKGQTEKKSLESKLFNGYVWTSVNKMGIDWGLPMEKIIDAMQTGPMLINEGRTLELKLTDDKGARRMIALIDGEKMRFMTIYTKNSPLDGPLLSDLPSLVFDVVTQKEWPITNAINLDGGSASAFYSPTVSLVEFSPVGSWWCVKK